MAGGSSLRPAWSLNIAAHAAVPKHYREFPVADHRRAAVSRRPLITAVVAGCVLCGVWLLPSAQAGEESRDGGGGEPSVSSEK
jgi:hypothetical protein